MFGLGGNDALVGLGGGDKFDGGLGFDTVVYQWSGAAVTASLANPGMNTGGAKGDSYTGIEGFRGTNYNDYLQGDSGNNILNGGVGADILDGGANADMASYQNAVAGLTVSLLTPSLNTGEALGDVFISIERLRGSAFVDFLQGDDGSNRLEGLGGADKLDGGNGHDYASYVIATAAITVSLANSAKNTGEAIGDQFISIEGLWGSDFNDTLTGRDNESNTLVGWLGADTLIGGDGTGVDIAAYFTAPFFGTAGVVASLLNPSVNTGDAAGDKYIGIEGLHGTAFADTLTGDNADNVLRGDAGNDVLIGGSGSNDGADSFDGGDGLDAVSYAAATVGFTANLSDATKNTGAALGDTFQIVSSGNTNIERLRGGSGDDVLVGNANAFTALNGGAGADQLIGGTGRDTAAYNFSTTGITVSLLNPGINTGEAVGDTYTSIERLRGTGFDDYLQGDDLNNELEGGAGADILVGGSKSGSADGFDFAWYFNSLTGLTVSLGDTSKNTGDAKGDTYISIEGVWGSEFDDVLFGSDANDSLNGGAGADALYGGAGSDQAAYFGTISTVGFTVDLADSSKNTGDAKGDTYNSIEGLLGTNFADLLYGNSGNNFLSGYGGADTLIGRGAGDKLDGGDSFGFSSGDIASYRDSTIGITADLGVGTDNTLSNATNTGDAKGDTYIGIEGLEGSVHDDKLSGDGSNNFLIGGLGKDALHGGGGSDTASYEFAAAGVTADLSASANNTGEADGDTYDSIENLRGSKLDDFLTGNAVDNTVDGGVGEDWIDASGGNDTIVGGSDWDTLTFWNAANAVTVNLGSIVQQTVGDVDGDTVADKITLNGDIEAVVGSDFSDTLTASGQNSYLDGWGGNDTVTGGAGKDILVGGEDNDILSGGDGDDIFNAGFQDTGDDEMTGGEGGETAGDTVSYEDAGAGVTVDLSNGSKQNTVGAGEDTLAEIENLTGSDFQRQADRRRY